MSHLGPDLPEDIWQHIHSLLPLRDAARAACVSRAFLSSWRRHPNLTLTMQTLGYFDFTKKVEHILKNHSGIGVKKLNLEFAECYNVNNSNHLDSWLQISVTPQLEELTLKVCPDWFSDEEYCSSMLEYKFPCSVFSDGSEHLIQYLDLERCAFRPTLHLGPLGSLTRLHLRHVCITGDELGCFISSSLALEWLELEDCYEIICLKIPGLLHRLSYLHVYGCGMLQEIENKAQNLRTIYFGYFPALRSPGESVQLGELLQLKKIDIWCSKAVYYAREELPSIAPNLETLTMSSLIEMENAPTAPSTFLHLKFLCIHLGSVKLPPAYDYFSLASFIDASPSLETFNLNLPRELTVHDWYVIGGSSDLRQMPQCRHHNLQSFKITSFGSAKSLVELTCYILESSTSLKCVTLDTTLSGAFRCSDNKSRKCFSMPKGNIMGAQKAILAIKAYITGKVSATVKLKVVEPCRRCHAIEM